MSYHFGCLNKRVQLSAREFQTDDVQDPLPGECLIVFAPLAQGHAIGLLSQSVYHIHTSSRPHKPLDVSYCEF